MYYLTNNLRTAIFCHWLKIHLFCLVLDGFPRKYVFQISILHTWQPCPSVLSPPVQYNIGRRERGRDGDGRRGERKRGGKAYWISAFAWEKRDEDDVKVFLRKKEEKGEGKSAISYAGKKERKRKRKIKMKSGGQVFFFLFPVSLKTERKDWAILSRFLFFLFGKMMIQYISFPPPFVAIAEPTDPPKVSYFGSNRS